MRQCILCDGWMRGEDGIMLECDQCGITEPDDEPKPDERRVRCEGLGGSPCKERWETFVVGSRWPDGRHLGRRCYQRYSEKET